MGMDRKYFAMLPQGSRDAGEAIVSKFEAFQEAYKRSSLYNSTREALAMYYNRDPRTGAMLGATAHIRKDSKGNTIVDYNEFKSLVDQIVIQAVEYAKGLQPLPGNTDVAVQRGAEIGRFLLKAETSKPVVEDAIRRQVVDACLYAEAWIVTTWDPTAGKPVDVDEDGEPVYEGALKVEVTNLASCARDRIGNPDDPKWFSFVTTTNRWELAAQYPKLADHIAECEGRFDSAREDLETLLDEGGQFDDEDQIEVLTFFHAPSRAVPKGRYSQLLPDGTFLFDFFGTLKRAEGSMELGLPYRRVPAIRLAHEDVEHARWPFAATHDLIPTSRLFQAQIGKIATRANNQTTVVCIPDDATYGADDLRDRAIIRVGDGQEPKAVSFGGILAEDLTWMRELRSLGETLAVVSPASRGTSQQGDSGTKTETLIDRTEAFSAGFGKRVSRAYSAWGTLVIQIYADHATGERLAVIAGKNLMAETKRFVAEDLAAVDQVQTVAEGQDHIDLATRMVELKLIPEGDAAMFMAVARDGLTAVTSERQVDEALLIRAENERMTFGEEPAPVVTPGEDHVKHIVEHLASAATEENRYDIDGSVQRHMVHILRHVDALRQDHPDFVNNVYFLLATDQQPFPTLMELFGQGVPGMGGAEQAQPGPAEAGIKGEQSEAAPAAPPGMPAGAGDMSGGTSEQAASSAEAAPVPGAEG